MSGRNLILAFAAAIAIAHASAAADADPGTNNGPGYCGTGNGQFMSNANCNQSPPPQPPPVVLNHVPLGSYGGGLLATVAGTVTQAQMRANADYITNPSVGSGPGRGISVCYLSGVCKSVQYTDSMRLTFNVPAQPGYAMANDAAFNETNPHPWFLHWPTQTSANRTSVANSYNINFNEPQTSTLWRAAVDGTVNAILSPLMAAIFNGGSPGQAGDSQTGQTMDAGDIIFSDTSAVDLAALTGSSVTVEIGTDTALVNAQNTWLLAAMRHVNGSPYNVWMNGVNRGQNRSTTLGQGSCSLIGAASCITLVDLANVTGGIFEFFMQSLFGKPGHEQSNFALTPFGVNSATSVIAEGRTFIELEEFESHLQDPHCFVVGTTANTMMAYFVAYLLTYNPANPGAEVSWLDVDSHLLKTNSCSPGVPAADESPNRFSSWPIQTLAPAGIVAIPVTAYQKGAGPTYGIDGCANHVGPSGETDSGGIVSYFVPLSCQLSDDGSMWIGTYANASSSCTVAGVAIGPCIYTIDSGPTNFTFPCSEVVTLGIALAAQGYLPGITWNSSTFLHRVDIGQRGVGVLQDILPSDGTGGGGTIAYSAATSAPAFLCGSGTTGVVVGDSGEIFTN